MRDPLQPLRLSVVIIARNEEAHIGQCVESVLAAVAGIAACEVVLVDSRSDDGTLQIARSYPIRIVELSGRPRCCPALGRHVGGRLARGRYVQFVDGDTTIDAGWLSAALQVLDSEPGVAALGGREDQIYYRGGERIGGKADYFGTGAQRVEVQQLGGNGLYRRAALEQVGSFNPYLRSFEEAELGARLRHAGWRLLRVPVPMGHHHTPRPDALDEYWRRVRSHLLTGQGQVLRLSLRQGLFREHFAQLNRLVLFLVWLLAGAVAAGGGLALGSDRLLALWLVASVLLLAVFALRSRSLTKPFRLTVDWAICSVPFLWGLLLPRADPTGFDLAGAIAAHGSGASADAVGERSSALVFRDAIVPKSVRSQDL